jgi:hypothetical protein
VLLRADVASAAGWPNGPGRGPPISFLSPSDLVSYTRAVADSSKEEDFLTSFEAVPAMPRPNRTAHARLTSNSIIMLPFDIRHPSRDATFNLHRKRQPVADFQAANFAIVNTTDVFQKFHHWFFQIELRRVIGRRGCSGRELQNLHHRGPGVQDQCTDTNFNGFEMAETELLKGSNEAALGRRKVTRAARRSSSRTHHAVASRKWFLVAAIRLGRPV